VKKAAEEDMGWDLVEYDSDEDYDIFWSDLGISVERFGEFEAF
jgi:hypothetical protein